MHEHSSWDTDGNSYSEDRIYTRSTDGAGHYRHLRVNVPPTIAGQLESLVSSASIPAYRSTQDVVRDAIVHRLRWLAENRLADEQDVLRAIEVEMRKCRLDAITSEVNELNGMVEAAQMALEQAVQARDWFALYSALQQAQLEAEAIRDPYQARIFQIVADYRTRYGIYLGDDT